ncbi:hypothetical protein GQ600_15005 [Phytophthora cactorum]|nr:hypothetical protein GQ600_15005 [Phytophthora cactorum]
MRATSTRFPDVPISRPKQKRTRNNNESPVNASTRDRILQQVAENGVDTIQAKRIFYYDPLNQAPRFNAANAVATHLKISGLQECDIIPQNNPIQSMPIAAVCTSAGCLYDKSSLGRPSSSPCGRFSATKYDGEGKVRPPGQGDQQTHDEDDAPTQLAT